LVLSVVWIYWSVFPLLVADLLYLIGLAIGYYRKVLVPRAILKRRQADSLRQVRLPAAMGVRGGEQRWELPTSRSA
jgi:hypothetical protein